MLPVLGVSGLVGGLVSSLSVNTMLSSSSSAFMTLLRTSSKRLAVASPVREDESSETVLFCESPSSQLSVPELSTVESEPVTRLIL